MADGPAALGRVLQLIPTHPLGPMGGAVALFRYLVFQDPNWDWKTLDFDVADKC
jgi:hypothetical protein